RREELFDCLTIVKSQWEGNVAQGEDGFLHFDGSMRLASLIGIDDWLALLRVACPFSRLEHVANQQGATSHDLACVVVVEILGCAHHLFPIAGEDVSIDAKQREIWWFTRQLEQQGTGED